MRRYTIRVTLDVPVDMPDDWDGNPTFYFEENGCPGTGAVGSALEKAIQHGHDTNTCWACNMGGENRIIKNA
jgi:hypothetical protein